VEILKDTYIILRYELEGGIFVTGCIIFDTLGRGGVFQYWFHESYILSLS